MNSAATARHWLLRGGKTLGVSPFCVMGIVNLTPDSFYDGGAHGGNAQAGFQRALQLLEQGAHVLDLGAESSRPGAREIGPEEEQARLLPVLRAIREHPRGRDAVISVDTYRASTARIALEAGADIINDISAARFDPDMLDVLVRHQPGYVLMHCKGKPKDMQCSPRYNDVVDEVSHFFATETARLTSFGLAEEKVVLDPGIGFGKHLEDNLALLRAVPHLASFGRPLLIGLSMKSMFGDLLGLELEKRGPAMQTASALLYARGVTIHRVHDVVGALQALRLAGALMPVEAPAENAALGVGKKSA